MRHKMMLGGLLAFLAIAALSLASPAQAQTCPQRVTLTQQLAAAIKKRSTSVTIKRWADSIVLVVAPICAPAPVPPPAPPPPPHPVPPPPPPPAPAPPPPAPVPPGSNNMYFNSAEPGCGTDPMVLLCDDFEDGDWYTKDYDQAVSSGGLLQTDGWGGTIYANPITPVGAAVCGGAGYRSNCAATSGYLDGSIGGRNMADHSFNGEVGVDEAYFRIYYQPQLGYNGGHEKQFMFTRGGAGSGQLIAHTVNYFGTQVVRFIPYLHQDDGVQGQADGWMGPNLGAADVVLIPGNWYFIEMHVTLNTPGVYDGIYEYWMDDLGPTGLRVPGAPTKRGRYTNVKYRNASTEAGYQLRGIWIENWANAPSTGTLYYDQVKVSKVGPIGFIP